jgi:hypothetical protein
MLRTKGNTMKLTDRQKELVCEWFRLIMEEEIENGCKDVENAAEDCDTLDELLQCVHQGLVDGIDDFFCMDPARRQRIREIHDELGTNYRYL